MDPFFFFNVIVSTKYSSSGLFVNNSATNVYSTNLDANYYFLNSNILRISFINDDRDLPEEAIVNKISASALTYITNSVIVNSEGIISYIPVSNKYESLSKTEMDSQNSSNNTMLPYKLTLAEVKSALFLIHLSKDWQKEIDTFARVPTPIEGKKLWDFLRKFMDHLLEFCQWSSYFCISVY